MIANEHVAGERMNYIVSLSGGKDSTAMLLRMIEEGWRVDEIIFCDTGMEFLSMYEHLDKVKAYIGRPITRLKAEKSFEYYMFEHSKTKGKNKGKKGYGWSSMWCRWCTTKFKQEPSRKYLNQKYGKGNYIQYIGIAADETHRAKNKTENIRYPLIEWGMEEKDALKYCYDRDFNWSGLYKIFHRVSCWCCPLQSIAELKQLYIYYPELWQKLLDMDERAFNRFKDTYSVQDLDKRFEAENRQMTLLDLDN